MAIEKLNKDFIDYNVLSAEELNIMTDKTDELVDSANDIDELTAAILGHQQLSLHDLLSMLLEVIRGEAYLDCVLTRDIKIDGAPLTLVRAETPDESPAFVGQRYIDTSAKVAYIAVGTDSVSDWKSITH